MKIITTVYIAALAGVVMADCASQPLITRYNAELVKPEHFTGF